MSERGGRAAAARDSVATGTERDERDPRSSAGSIANAPPIGSTTKATHHRADLLTPTLTPYHTEILRVKQFREGYGRGPKRSPVAGTSASIRTSRNAHRPAPVPIRSRPKANGRGAATGQWYSKRLPAASAGQFADQFFADGPGVSTASGTSTPSTCASRSHRPCTARAQRRPRPSRQTGRQRDRQRRRRGRRTTPPARYTTASRG